jgi:hypothetical protein
MCVWKYGSVDVDVGVDVDVDVEFEVKVWKCVCGNNRKFQIVVLITSKM